MAYVGGNIDLPCTSQKNGSEIKFLYMQKYANEDPLFVNGIHKERSTKEQISPVFRNRTSLNEFSKTVNLWDIRITDEGMYDCIIMYYPDVQVSSKFWLTVLVNYSTPVLTVPMNSSGNSTGAGCLIEITCSSSGGYPQKNIKWNLHGNESSLEKVNESIREDPVTRLFNISSTISVNASGPINVSCSVGEETSPEYEACMVKIHPPDPPTDDNSLHIAVALIGLFVIILITVLANKMKNRQVHLQEGDTHRNEHESIVLTGIVET
nr:PREDICTED: T-lymphocyte activation antigen CD86-like isoform X2 [Lepisosteus oculatus]